MAGQSEYSLTVSSFYMDETEVTKAQWDTVYNWAEANGYSFDNPGSGKAANHPVNSVNWYDCVKWCNARSQMNERTPCYTVSGSLYKTGSYGPEGSDVVVCNFSANGYRLPTNDEWEYAARGGLSGKRFPWGDTITHSQANYYSDSDYSYDTSSTRGFHPSYDSGDYPYTSPVGSFSPNGYGLYDLADNVSEWSNTTAESHRIIKGRSWIEHAIFLRCAIDFWLNPDCVNYGYGFRSVCR